MQERKQTMDIEDLTLARFMKAGKAYPIQADAPMCSSVAFLPILFSHLTLFHREFENPNHLINLQLRKFLRLDLDKVKQSDDPSLFNKRFRPALHNEQCLSPALVDGNSFSQSKHRLIIYSPRRTDFETHVRYCRGVRPNCT